ncbi:MAG TPA: hypothetical protein VHS09_00150, partial [Polyangiaceae bacterium]|nr:hypothetical protein [Polyangiaceae bacterium]
MKLTSSLPLVLGAVPVLWGSAARADVPLPEPRLDTAGAASVERVPTSDPTGGAYTSPTLLFIPAGALPVWNVHVLASTEVQSPSDVHAGFRPGLGVELGLPAGITLGAGTNWVGGDVDPDTGNTDFNLGLSPYFQARLHLVGRADGQGLQLGTSATYKFVGFEGDPGEVELAVSAQYRQRRFEVGLQGVVGKDFATTDADGEVHAYALYRVIPQLGIGGAGQVRTAIVSQPGETTYDVVGGAIASLTVAEYQVGVLAGGSTLGLAQGQAGALAQVFAGA